MAKSYEQLSSGTSIRKLAWEQLRSDVKQSYQKKMSPLDDKIPRNFVTVILKPSEFKVYQAKKSIFKTTLTLFKIKKRKWIKTSLSPISGLKL